MTTRPTDAARRARRDHATFEVEVRHDDKPVAGAEVALIVVDEAVLALSAKRHADPLAPFYRDVGAGHVARSTIDTWSTTAGDELAGEPGVRAVQARRRPERSASALRLRRRAAVGTLGGTGAIAPRSRIGAAIVEVAQGLPRERGVLAAAQDRRERQGRAHGEDARQPDALPHRRARDRERPATSARPRATIVTQRKINARTDRAAVPHARRSRSRCRSSCRTSTARRARSTSRCARRTSSRRAPPASASRSPAGPARRGPLRLRDAGARQGRRSRRSRSSGDFADASNVEVPGLRAGDHRVVRDLRHRRRRAGSSSSSRCPTDIFPDVGGVEVELASTQLAVAHRRVLVPLRVSVRVRGAALGPHARDRRRCTTSSRRSRRRAGRRAGEIEAHARSRTSRLLATQQNRDGGWGYFRGMPSPIRS